MDGKWNPQKMSKACLDSWSGLSKSNTFRPLTDLFNDILAYPPATTSQKDVRCMVHASWTAPKSDRISNHWPDAFLLMNSSLEGNPSDTPGNRTSNPVHWRDVTCPFEYKFGDGNKVENRDKLIWNLHHLLRCDPQRAFAFGVTVVGTKLCIWLGCHITLYKYHSIDWFKEPDQLIRFFIFLAFLNESDLGFDGEIEQLDNSDFELRFPIQKKDYLMSTVLYDIGADSMCGHGTWVFEAHLDPMNLRPYVIKDCWVEERPGKQMEHLIIKKVQEAMSYDKFHEHFVDFCSYCRVVNAALAKYSKNLFSSGLDTGSEAIPLIREAEVNHAANYSLLGQAMVASQDSYLESGTRSVIQQHHPHPRFRYQIVYTERGVSLYNITLLLETFECLIQVMNSLLLLHEVGFVHRDLSPGNIIVVDRKAKISDLEFGKARKVADLQSLAQQPEGSSVFDTRTGTLNFATVEVVKGCYKFHPLLSFKGDPTFLYTPLHDYESVWWIATWVIFSCTLNTTMNSTIARDELFSHRAKSFAYNKFKVYGCSLPKELQPLVAILEGMRQTLVTRYTTYEIDFDGSSILDVVPDLITHLQDLVKAAKAIRIEPLQGDEGEVVGGGKVEPDKGVAGDDAGAKGLKHECDGSIGGEHPDRKHIRNSFTTTMSSCP
ncbi:hypothetical protein BDM02DRAFT_3132663 [Thelephora ganbajun]|uniref:Uncharacterized protein n=1 Tax=Thelephora ganbajun TaxID=370292 RepID=A0ACB6Z120_THEGA|nr:hypothetical protein BDM02DRAFT_3132663 [Thelephora ganbajun]